MLKSRLEHSLRSSVTPFCDAKTAAFASAGRSEPVFEDLVCDSAQQRENSLFKAEMLLGALHRFRDGLAAEAELAARRHH